MTRALDVVFEMDTGQILDTNRAHQKDGDRHGIFSCERLSEGVCSARRRVGEEPVGQMQKALNALVILQVA